MYQATDKNRGVKILSYKQLKHEFDVASLLFSGRETDNNWESRQAFFEKVRLFLSSNDAKTHKKELVDKIHEVIPGIYNTIKSVRTTLIEEALSLVEAIGVYLGDSINMHTNEAILRFLMSESSVTKKAIAFRAFEATNKYLTKTRFRPKVLTFLCTQAQEKNPQLREFALGYIKTVLFVHGPANKSRLIEYADLMQAIATALQKGLVDAIPTVRSACKGTYYVFEEHWPTVAYELASKLDVAIQRRLGINTAQSSSATSKSAKPLIRRTSKSTAGAIKKPTSSVGINRAVRSDIRAAMQKPSNATSSSASKSHTHGFNLSNHRQTMAKKPAQTPSPAAMSRTERDTTFNTAPSMESDTVMNTTPSMESDTVMNTTPSTESGIISTVPSAESGTEVNTTVPNAESGTEMNTTPDTKSDTVMSTTPSVNTDTLVSSALNTTPISEPSPTTTINSPQVSPQLSPQAKYHPQLSPTSNPKDVSSSFNSKELSSSSNSQELLSSFDSRDLSLSSSSQEVSSQPTEPLSIAVENLPHQPVKTPSRRGSRIMPSPTSSSSNERFKSPLHLTKKTSAGAIKKPAGPHSISQTAKLVKRARSVMSPISNTDIPARSSSVSAKLPAVATAKQPRQLDVATQRRLGLLPAGSESKPTRLDTLASKGSKSPLHLTKRTSTGAIKKPVGPYSISRTARLVKKSHGAMPLIPTTTEIPARSSSSVSDASSTAKQPRQSDLATQRRLGVLPAGPVPPSHTSIMPSPTSSSGNKSSAAITTTKSPRPKLRKSVNLLNKYDHITSRYKNIPAHRK
ncbi:clasp N terminal-domain-containing protein [Mucor lusitanicus]|uniref:Clasp N terminal-domain-containing protein n=1 Tax=Mucor circinelloides f. lusitanicus TaxID=29924 RepID=A0A8H4BFS3_MUCCL|nr:clasp N terminal-domain-containing protein [Mucor lusitanicus]